MVFVELDVDFLLCKVLDVSGMKIDFIIVLHHRNFYFCQHGIKSSLQVDSLWLGC